MKVFITIIVGVFIFCLGFYGANELISVIINQLPKSCIEWAGLIRIGLWIIGFSSVLGISIFLAGIVGTIVFFFLGGE